MIHLQPYGNIWVGVMSNVKPHSGTLFIRKEETYHGNIHAFMLVFIDEQNCAVTLDIDGNGVVSFDPNWEFEGYERLTKWQVIV
jgi:hypothetical protein